MSEDSPTHITPPGAEPPHAPVPAATADADGAAPASTDPSSHMRPRPGDLVGSWRVMLTVAWCAALLAYAAIWQASVQIGISTWWLGPRAQPTNPAIKMLPFALTLTVAVLVIYDVRRPIRVSAAGIVAAVAIGLPDFTRSTGLALAELLIPASLALVTAAAMTGQYRLRTPHAPLPTDLVATSAASAPWAPPIS